MVEKFAFSFAPAITEMLENEQKYKFKGVR